jgi:quinol monooxygenase YgiN
MNRFALLVTVRVHPGRAEDFLLRIREAAAAAVREEPHCLSFEVAQDEADPDLFVLFEVYTDAAALAHHHTTPHFLTFQAQAGPWIAEKTRRRLTLFGAR